ncbi:RNA polymerase archaeal subunit P/eukaryotic subunit RPC10 [Penicillium taxi]|uniref:RNA polymerase archaeal subunit P/eukaryotic subunit RPC10 n=1 Tax=Penicillium taxi TaxID=168475 RepID=UPI002544EA82|nr:RNA polymerase archaeal subunit P/eukaryotic subunit RPC10 [Penicillium taxi]KAJ5899068.1 RNA polymerase archaeal subunit P/eukaryotic subunit RPC10 [Penicillium taxi]
MSREAYQVPTGPSNFESGYSNNATSTTDSSTVTYLCGECAARVPLKRGDQIRCRDCGHRVLYKERTKRMVQFEAR